MVSADDAAFAMIAVMQTVLAVVWLLGTRIAGDQRPAALYWTAFAVLSAISFVLLIVARRANMPEQTEILRACGNVVGVIAFIALRRGVGHFVARPANAGWDFLLFGIALVASVIGLLPEGGRERVGLISGALGVYFLAIARALHIHARDHLHFQRPWLLAVPFLCATAGFWFRGMSALVSTTAVSNEASADIGLNVRAALVYMILSLTFHATLVALVVGRLLADLGHKARHDVLTGLLNRRAAEDAIDTQMQRGRRTGETFSLLMLDIDHFKNINDRFGHPVGDLALKHVATVLQSNVRAIDQVARIGGEEFLVLMPNAPLDAARPVAERLREQLVANPLRWQTLSVPLSVSIGIAQSAGPSEETSRLLVRLDAALYQAKAEGRNRVIAADSGATIGQRPAGREA